MTPPTPRPSADVSFDPLTTWIMERIRAAEQSAREQEAEEIAEWIQDQKQYLGGLGLKTAQDFQACIRQRHAKKDEPYRPTCRGCGEYVPPTCPTCPRCSVVFYPDKSKIEPLVNLATLKAMDEDRIREIVREEIRRASDERHKDLMA